MKNVTPVAGAIMAALLLFPVHGWADSDEDAPKSLTLGIYCPNCQFGGSGERWGYINRLARHLENITKIPTRARAFGSAGAFSGGVAKVDFAVVDPVYMCRQGGRFRVLLTGRLGGGSRASWGLFARSATGGVMGLKGQRLIMAESGGAEASLAEGLLAGQIAVRKFFGSVRQAPDLVSAIAAVRGGSADAVFAPRVMGAGLAQVYAAGSVPNAAFVLVRKDLPSGLVSKIRAAVRGYGATGVGGWGDPAGYSCAFGRKRYSMAVARPRVVRFSGRGIVDLDLESDFVLPDVRKYFWRPR